MNWLLHTDIREICESLPAAMIRSFEGAHVTITGGRGFLGRYFCEVFRELNRTHLSRPCEVAIFDTMITAGAAGQDFQADERFEFFQADVSDPDWEPTFSTDYILHCAGIASPYYYRQYPLETIAAAVDGGRNVLKWATRVGARVLVFSSSEIYGNPAQSAIPTREDYPGLVLPMGARACYDESKRLAETLVSVYQKKHKTKAMVVRPFNVFGPGMQAKDYRVLPTVAALLLRGEEPVIYGNGEQTRTFCYITDAIRGFLQVLVEGSPGCAYNIGNPEPEISMNELMGEIALACPWLDVKYKTGPYPDSYPGDEPMRRCPSITKAWDHVCYSPSIKLRDGLARFFLWAREAYR